MVDVLGRGEEAETLAEAWRGEGEAVEVVLAVDELPAVVEEGEAPEAASSLKRS